MTGKKSSSPCQNSINALHKVTRPAFLEGGLGTRVLPATQSTPKETVLVVDKPRIQNALEEAVAAAYIFCQPKKQTSINPFPILDGMRGWGKRLNKDNSPFPI